MKLLTKQFLQQTRLENTFAHPNTIPPNLRREYPSDKVSRKLAH